MSSAPDASVVIVSFNTRDLLRECIGTLYRRVGAISFETIVVDNSSKDGSADMVAAEFPEVRLIRSATNLGFAAANNRALRSPAGAM
jgi:GT2 family glycosyltransferase